MRLFGLIGNPLAQSFSKKYFSAKFEKEGISGCRYELYQLESIDELPQLISSQPELQGLNVTIPFKKQVLPYLDSVDEVTSRVQACNCIKLKGGKLTGFNTDITGFEKTFAPHLRPYHTKALILGKGGANAAIEYVLNKLGLAYASVSRTSHSGATFNYSEITKEIIEECKVIINTTPLGSYPNVQESPDIPYEFITPKHYLFDVIYNPALSLFLEKGRQKGATTCNGYEWLTIQAEESWKIWNG
jgi:shikimate dehydrogenase